MTRRILQFAILICFLAVLAGLAGAASAPAESPQVLTPKPGPEPKINGARIFGVRPGSPFLFTIPATGERPMTFAVDGLPAGLQVDPATGRISGRVMDRGEYIVTLRAENGRGRAERKFKIVCGDTLALTPHMGWNSWYVWENNVTEKIMRDAAEAMASSGMIDHGYMYVNIDDCWSVKPGAKDPTLQGAERDAKGKVNSNPRFPDMKGLTDFIHDKGLKAGIYASPGPKTCADHVAKNELHKYGGPGGWNDPDYLLLGYLSNWKGQTVPTPLTPNDQYTHVSLWSLVAAPLIFSGDITRLDDFTLGLLTNDEVIDVDQDPLGKPGRRLTKTGDLEIWARELEDGSLAVGLFNRGESLSVITAAWADLGLQGKRRVRDLWRQKDVGVFEGTFEAAVAGHGVVLVRMWPANQ